MSITLNKAREEFSNFLETSLVAKEGGFIEQRINELSQHHNFDELKPVLLQAFYDKITINRASIRGTPEQITLYLRQRLRIIEAGALGELSQLVDHNIVKQKFQELLAIMQEITLDSRYITHINMHLKEIKEKYKIK